MEIYPERYRRLFEATFEWLALRPCARRRGLGTRLPFDERWIIESLSDSTIYMAFYTIIHHIRQHKVPPDALTPEVFDYIFLGKGDPSVISQKTGIKEELLRRMRAEFLYWYPVDVRHTAVGHITNHLSFFIFHHVAIFPPELWPRSITLNEYVIREGAKMSKSRGNVLPLVEIPRKYSADLYRLYITYAADLSTVVDWREKQVLSVLRRLRDFWSTANEIIRRGPRPRPSRLSFPTRWLISIANSAIKKATRHLENYRYRDYVQEAFFNLLNAMEKYRRMAIDVPEDERAWAEHYVLERWVKLLSPVIPHITEELWERMGMKPFLSTEQWPKADESLINRELELAVEAVDRTIADVREILRVVKGIKPTRVYIYVGPAEWQYELCKVVASSEGLKIDEMIRQVMKIPSIRRHGKDAVRLVKMIVDGKAPRFVPSRSIEIMAFNELRRYIERELGLKVEIQDALKPSYDPKQRAKLSLPGRPGVYIE